MVKLSHQSSIVKDLLFSLISLRRFFLIIFFGKILIRKYNSVENRQNEARTSLNHHTWLPSRAISIMVKEDNDTKASSLTRYFTWIFQNVYEWFSHHSVRKRTVKEAEMMSFLGIKIIYFLFYYSVAVKRCVVLYSWTMGLTAWRRKVSKTYAKRTNCI